MALAAENREEDSFEQLHPLRLTKDEMWPWHSTETGPPVLTGITDPVDSADSI